MLANPRIAGASGATASLVSVFSLLALLVPFAAACSGMVQGERGPDPEASGGSDGKSAGGDPGAGGGSNGSGGTRSEAGTGGTAASHDAGAGGMVVETCVTGTIPTAVQTVLDARCWLCHGDPPIAKVPGTLLNHDDFLRPTKVDPTKTAAQVTVERITTTTAMRMPPPPAAALSAGEAQTLRGWIEAGMPLEACTTGGDGGRPDGGGLRPDAGPDPFAVPPKCTSGTLWTRGEDARMRPGEACVSCHAKDAEAPKLSFGGTVYPSAHEPDRCNGADGTTSAKGAQIVVIDANGMSFTANVNAAGNFYANARVAVALPLKAKVVFMGRERVMIGAVPTGDCNACHTQTGTTTVTGMNPEKAPGRIILP
jgi:hypothetical protein